MFTLRSLVFVVTMAVGVMGAPGQEVGPNKVVLARQDDENFYSKNWANEDAVVEYDDRDGGEFAVTWDQPNGGNFVVGKGYNPGFDM
jgi:hypothetical protein